LPQLPTIESDNSSEQDLNFKNNKSKVYYGSQEPRGDVDHIDEVSLFLYLSFIVRE
jgi:hypothetical protein